VIKYEWRDSLGRHESAELAAMLARAAGYDAEAEYNTIDFADVEATLGQPHTRHLLIWMLPRSVALDRPDEPERIAGLLRLVFTSDSLAEATVVIDPKLRSLGILTLLLEKLGVDAAAGDGWAGTGADTVTASARGNHPAAGRISDRFLIPRTCRTWKLIRSADSAESIIAAPVLESIPSSALPENGWQNGVARGGQLLALREAGKIVGLTSLDMQPVHSPEIGACATIACIAHPTRADAGPLRRLLAGAAATAHDAGFDGVVIYVDSDDVALVNACRLTGFQHDRTDVCYQLGGPR
jgi:mycothiol synthase